MTRLVGYTRELLPGEGTATDVEELDRAGVTQIFADSGYPGAGTRTALRECLSAVEPGDTLVVTSAVRLSHTVSHFVATVSALRAREVYFRSLAEAALSVGVGASVDPGDVLAALEGLKRRLVSVQTRAGMASAAAEGRRPGRPTVMTPERIAMAVELRNLGRPNTHIARVLGVSPNAVQRALATRSAAVGDSASG